VGTVLGLAAGAREVIGRRKAGELFPLELTVSAMPFGGEYVTIMFTRDVSKRKRAQRCLTAHYAATCALVEARSLVEALPRILQAICESLHWTAGAFWQLDPCTGRLRCTHLYHAPGGPAAAAPDPERLSCRADEGLPGRVWCTAQPVWVENVQRA